MSNSLASVHPELIPEWSERNLPLTPDYPSYGWINVQSIMSYFQMTPEMSLWFENNIN